MTTNAESIFWNDDATVAYFESKPPDPRIAHFLNTHFSDSTNVQALDLGCGGGRHSELLASNGFRLSSVDVNPAMISMTAARLRNKNLEGAVGYGSILDIPFPDRTFDVVITTGVLHQAKNSKDYDVAISELARVLKVGGYVLLNIFTDSVWDETYVHSDSDSAAVITHEGLSMTLLSSVDFNDRMRSHDLICIEDFGEDIKQENTGPRAVYRAHYQKNMPAQPIESYDQNG